MVGVIKFWRIHCEVSCCLVLNYCVSYINRQALPLYFYIVLLPNMENSLSARIKVKHHREHRSSQKSQMTLQIRVSPSVLVPKQIILTKILMILILVGIPPPPPQVSVLNFEMFMLVLLQ